MMSSEVEDVKAKIEKVIRKIAEERSLTLPALKNDTEIVDELGFSSMMVAGLIANLEEEFGVDPFQDEDVMITDIQMPRMDGFELIKEVRQHEINRGIGAVPIVVLTADAQSEQISRVKGLGGNGYLTKPISKAGLIGLLTSYTRASRAS